MGRRKSSRRYKTTKQKGSVKKSNRTDRCANPFKLKGHLGKNLRKPSKAFLQRFPDLLPIHKVCHKCRKSKLIVEVVNNVEDNVNENDNSEFRIGYDAIDIVENNSLQNSGSADPRTSGNDNHGINNDHISERERDLEEIFMNIKSKFHSLSSTDPLRLRLLTLAPSSWSEREVCREFNTNRRAVHNAKLLKNKYGIMGETCSKRGKNLEEDTIKKIIEFYNDDDISRVMASVSDTVTMTVDGEKRKVQKRLLLLGLKELHVLYKEHNPRNPVSFSLFAKLRPKNCILPGKSGTHSTCVCVIHQNVKLLLEAVDLKSLTAGKDFELHDYKDCIKMIVCKNPGESCFLNMCQRCPGVNQLHTYLSEILSESLIEEVKYAYWTETDRSTLMTVLSPVKDYLDELCESLIKVKSHSFIAKKQSAFIKEKTDNLKMGQLLVKWDFAQNQPYAIQDASQAFHWNNDQFPVFPCIYFYKTESEIVRKNCIFLSDSNKHDTSAVYTIQTQLIKDIKMNVPKVKRIIYVSDGAKQHFKNKFQMCNLKNHKKDFNISAEWHFTATAHGKSSCDGLGASFKREAFRASMKAKATESLINIKTIIAWAKAHYRGAKIFYYSKTDHDRVRRKLNSRFKGAEKLVGISKNHSFQI